MKYTIKTHKSVDKFLSSHPELAHRFIEKFTIIGNDPSSKLVDVKSYVGKANNYRLRIGKYRFIYEVRDHEILIWIRKADSRGDIY